MKPEVVPRWVAVIMLTMLVIFGGLFFFGVYHTFRVRSHEETAQMIKTYLKGSESVTGRAILEYLDSGGKIHCEIMKVGAHMRMNQSNKPELVVNKFALFPIIGNYSTQSRSKLYHEFDHLARLNDLEFPVILRVMQRAKFSSLTPEEQYQLGGTFFLYEVFDVSAGCDGEFDAGQVSDRCQLRREDPKAFQKEIYYEMIEDLHQWSEYPMIIKGFHDAAKRDPQEPVK